MGLRDRNFALNYSIPLFSGVFGAQQGGAHTSFVPGTIYTPYTRTDDESTCGEGVDLDTHIDTPTITYPTAGADVPLSSTALSSAFTTDDAQTHVASRWQIELSDAGGTETGTIVDDSGLTTVHLTSLPFSSLTTPLSPDGWYLIRVRYKGSADGFACADWSPKVLFHIPNPPLYRLDVPPDNPYYQIECAEFSTAAQQYIDGYNAANTCLTGPCYLFSGLLGGQLGTGNSATAACNAMIAAYNATSPPVTVSGLTGVTWTGGTGPGAFHCLYDTSSGGHGDAGGTVTERDPDADPYSMADGYPTTNDCGLVDAVRLSNGILTASESHMNHCGGGGDTSCD